MSDLFAAFGINWKLLLVQAINFGLLLFILWRFLYQPVLRMIDERREKIVKGVREAEEAARKLAASESEGKEIVANAAHEAEVLVSEARARADKKRAQLVREAEEKARGIIEDAAARAEETKRQVLLGTTRDIAQGAMLAAEKILRQKSV